MVKVENSYKKLSPHEISKFELQYNITLPTKYKEFLLESNGGAPEPSVFVIPDEPGISCINGLYGIYTGDYEDVGENMEVFKGRMPEGFIPIGDDPGGNQICLGINKEYFDNIYFWDHEEESNEPDMSNMYFLANNIYEFLDKLYDDE